MTESTAANDRPVFFEGADWSAFDLAYATALDDMDLAESERTEGNVALARRSPRSHLRVHRRSNGSGSHPGLVGGSRTELDLHVADGANPTMDSCSLTLRSLPHAASGWA